MNAFEQRRAAQEAAAQRRYEERVGPRLEQIDAIRAGDLAAANPPERIAARIDRLSRWATKGAVAQEPGELPVAPPAAVAAEALVRAGRADLPHEVAVAVVEAEPQRPLAAAGVVLERIHHVLPDAAAAAVSVVEFDFQDGRDGRQLPVKTFALDPAAFFLADEALDFALVAVGPGPEPIAGFGFNRLIEASGKSVIGEHVTIVQHPRGDKKQIALRDNKIVDRAEPMLHYEADTEPGSSGSPVFNDQWEVVALHHASVAAPDRPELGGFQNEGVLVRKIVEFVRAQPLPAAQRQLFDELVEPESLPHPPLPPSPVPSADGELVLPLELTLRLRAPGAGAPTASANGDGAAAETVRAAARLAIDPDYAGRRGYDPAFLGGATPVPLPTLSGALLAEAAVHGAPGDPEAHVLRYHHFSVIQSRVRRLAFVTAVNIDGAQSARIRRGRDRWVLDPRIPVAEQTGEAVYADNPLDRGHLVRRLDPAWGATAQVRQFANDDTFHFTNCTPQHEDFNQNQQTWAGLEDYVLENADNRDLRVSVFTGPVFAPDDDAFEGVQLPRQFWKVVAMVKADGRLSATAYLLSQERLLDDVVEQEADTPFSYGAYETFQVRVAEIARLTGLGFGQLPAADPLGALEATAATTRVLRSPDDAIL